MREFKMDDARLLKIAKAIYRGCVACDMRNQRKMGIEDTFTALKGLLEKDELLMQNILHETCSD